MTTATISSLPAASALSGAELLECVQSNVNSQTTPNAIASLIATGNVPTPGSLVFDGVTDNSVALQILLTAFAAAGGGNYSINAGSGSMFINSTVQIPSNVTMKMVACPVVFGPLGAWRWDGTIQENPSSSKPRLGSNASVGDTSLSVVVQSGGAVTFLTGQTIIIRNGRSETGATLTKETAYLTNAVNTSGNNWTLTLLNPLQNSYPIDSAPDAWSSSPLNTGTPGHDYSEVTVRVGSNINIPGSGATLNISGLTLNGSGGISQMTVPISAAGTGYVSSQVEVFAAAPPQGGRVPTIGLVLSGGAITSAIVTDPGAGYVSVPSLTISPVCPSGLTAVPVVSAAPFVPGELVYISDSQIAGDIVGGTNNNDEIHNDLSVILSIDYVNNILYIRNPTKWTISQLYGMTVAALVPIIDSYLDDCRITWANADSAKSSYPVRPIFAWRCGVRNCRLSYSTYGTGATFSIQMSGTTITGLTPIQTGSGYTGIPKIIIWDTAGNPGTGVVVVANVVGTSITSYTVTNGGTGYVAPSGIVSGNYGPFAMGVRLETCYETRITDNYYVGVPDPYWYSSGNGYGIVPLGSRLCEISGNYVANCRHNYLIQFGSSDLEVFGNISENARISGFDGHGLNTADIHLHGNTCITGSLGTPDASTKSEIRIGNSSHAVGDFRWNVHDNKIWGIPYTPIQGGSGYSSGIEIVPSSSDHIIDSNQITGTNYGFTFGQVNSYANQIGQHNHLSNNKYQNLVTGVYNINGGSAGQISISDISFDNEWSIHNSVHFTLSWVTTATLSNCHIVNPITNSGVYGVNAVGVSNLRVIKCDLSGANRGIKINTCPLAEMTDNLLQNLVESVVFEDSGSGTNNGYTFGYNDYTGTTSASKTLAGSTGNIYDRPLFTPYQDDEPSIHGFKDWNLSPKLANSSTGTALSSGVGSVNRIRARTNTTWNNVWCYVGTIGNTLTAATTASISGIVSSSGLIEITATAHGYSTGDVITISGIVGTVEANSGWQITVVDTNHFTLNNSVFVNAYISGGTASRSTNTIAIFNTSGQFLSVVTDQVSVWTGTTGLKSATLQPPLPVSSGSDYCVYVLSVGNTGVALGHGAGGVAGWMNGNLSAANSWFATNGTGLTKLPSSVTLSSNTGSGNSFIFAMS